MSIYDNSDFDRGASLWKEAVWYLARWIFFQTSLPWPSGLRVALLRLFGAKRGVVVRANVNISFPWRLRIGDHVWIAEDVGILSLAPVTIESNVCINQRAYLCTGSHDFRREDFKLRVHPITIRTGVGSRQLLLSAPASRSERARLCPRGQRCVRDCSAERRRAGKSRSRDLKAPGLSVIGQKS